MNWKFWTQGTGSLFLAVAIALFIRWAFIEAYVIPSGSMLPSLLIHDHIFVNKLTYGIRIPFSEKWMVQFRKPERGEVIVFKKPDEKSIFYIKRVVGLPGDKISYQDNMLYVNDQPVERVVPSDDSDARWLRDRDFQSRDDTDTYYSHTLEVETKDLYIPWEERFPDYPHTILLRKGSMDTNYPFNSITVPNDKLFVMGDNRNNSQDSRYWGFLPMENLLGKAMFVWLSCEETYAWPFNLHIICDPTTIRWKRFFHSVHK